MVRGGDDGQVKRRSSRRRLARSDDPTSPGSEPIQEKSTGDPTDISLKQEPADSPHEPNELGNGSPKVKEEPDSSEGETRRSRKLNPDGQGDGSKRKSERESRRSRKKRASGQSAGEGEGGASLAVPGTHSEDTPPATEESPKTQDDTDRDTLQLVAEDSISEELSLPQAASEDSKIAEKADADASKENSHNHHHHHHHHHSRDGSGGRIRRLKRSHSSRESSSAGGAHHHAAQKTPDDADQDLQQEEKEADTQQQEHTGQQGHAEEGSNVPLEASPVRKSEPALETEEEKEMASSESATADVKPSASPPAAGDSAPDGSPPHKPMSKDTFNRKLRLPFKRSRANGDNSSEPSGEVGTSVPPKRRWSAISSTRSGSQPISSDTLKDLIPEVRPPIKMDPPQDDILLGGVADEDLVDMETTTQPPQPPPPPPVARRQVTIIHEDGSEGAKVRSEPKAAVVVSEAVTEKPRSASPARNPESKIIFIRNLVRPFTIGQLKSLLSNTGKIVEDGFWIDSIKSKCFVTYETFREAVTTRNALHSVRWPSTSPKMLIVDYADEDQLDFHRNMGAPKSSLPSAPPMLLVPAKQTEERSRPERPERVLPERPKERERGEQKENRSEREQRGASDRDRQRKVHRGSPERGQRRGERGDWGRRERAPYMDDPVLSNRRDRSPPHQPPVREWDQGKFPEGGGPEHQQETPAPQRGRRSPRRSPEPAPKEKRERRDRREKKAQKKEDKEAPAKLLDDLFRKTRATPCIYWLPLTAEQVEQRLQRIAKFEEERRRRRAQMDAERASHRDRPRDKIGGNERRRSRSRSRSYRR